MDKKIDECLAVCNKNDGWIVDTSTHRVCKIYNPDSYALFNKYFN